MNKLLPLSRTFIMAAVLVGSIITSHAWAQGANQRQNIPFSSPAEKKKQLSIVNKTIDNGSWRGSPGGVIEKMFKAQGRGQVKDVILETKVIGHFKDPDCKRIDYTYSVTTRQTGDEPQNFFAFQMNICRNGAPPQATPEELAIVMSAPANLEQIMNATVEPYTAEEEKTQMVRLLKQAVKQPGATFTEPMEDAEVVNGIRGQLGSQTKVTIALTVIRNTPKEDCPRVRIDTITDRPFPIEDRQAYGFRKEMTACAHGKISVVDTTMPAPLYRQARR